VNKADLVDTIYDHSPELTREQCALVIDRFIEIIGNSLSRGRKVEIRGLGTWHMKKRRSRTFQRPSDPTVYHVSAQNIPFFLPSRSFGKELDEMEDFS